MSPIASLASGSPFRIRRLHTVRASHEGTSVAFAKSASLSASIWSALALAAAQASAQETTSELGSDAIPSALEEIVVSATKREESLQRVPVSVNAISGDQLKQSGIVRLQDMQLPSLTVQEGGIG